LRKIFLCAALLLLILPLAACNNSGNRTPGGNDKISIPEMNPPLPQPELLKR
jgi:ABC-type oligopeptide transport system substrate-binding subunit